MVKTPQQNGLVERTYRYLLETPRQLRVHAGLPKYFRGECIPSATHIINQLPMANLKWQSPFELLFHSKSKLEKLSLLCCQA